MRPEYKTLNPTFFSFCLVSLGILCAVNGFAQTASGKFGGIPAGGIQRNGISQTAPSEPQPVFLPAVAYSSGGYGAGTIAVGDLNGDGKVDVVTTNQPCASGCPIGEIDVQLGNGDGSFQTAVTYSSGGTEAEGLAIADVNGDGHLDIVVTNQCVAGQQNCGTGVAADGVVSVLLGNGDGTFQPAVLYDSGGQNTFSVAIADVNHDGKPDLVVTNWDNRNNGNNTVGVLLGKGDGTFQPVATYNASGCGFQAFFAAVADVNGDGNPDLLVAIGNGDNTACGDGSVAVLLGKGDGTFGPAVQYDSGAHLPGFVAVADLNGDGKQDVLVLNFCGKNCEGDGSVGVLLGNGDGTFHPAVLYDSGGYGSEWLAVGDINGDGKLDVAVSSECNSNCKKGAVSVLRGNGDGTFQRLLGFDPVNRDGSIAMADVNGDGRPDLLVTNSSGGDDSGSVRVLLNNPAIVFTSKTAVSSSVNPSQLGQPVTFTAQVSSEKGIIKDGELITFFDGKVELAAVPLVGGKASYMTSSLPAKKLEIKAAYAGDQWVKASTGFVSQVVEK